MDALMRGLRETSGDVVLLAFAVFLHILVAAGVLALKAAPPPSTPKLRYDSIELEVAEIASETPISSPTPTPQAASVPQPIPEAARYLTGTAPLALPQPKELLPKPLPKRMDLPPMPEAPKMTSSLTPMELPEITLPPAQPAPPAQGATARIQEPKLVSDLSRLLKEYPLKARRDHIEGTVVLRLEVSADGRLKEASIHESSGHDILDQAALKMIRDARFSDGPGTLFQPITYKLK